MKTSSSIILFALFAQVAHGSVSNGTPVQLQVKCKGLDMNNLDIFGQTIAGQILEESHNAVHGTKDNGSSIKVTGSESRRWSCGSLCPDDDAIVLKSGNGDIVWGGRWSCGSLLCPNNGDAILSVGVRGGAAAGNMAAWEKNFLLGLLATRRADFQAVESCNIVMSASSKQISG
jgi:hypothetical protein